MKENAKRSQDIVTQLQSLMLTSIVQEQPLPGQTQPVRFPDLAFITEASKILISEDEVSGPLDTSGIDKPAEIVPFSAIREEAAKSGDRFFVQFRPVKEQEGQITIVMEVRMAPTQSDIQPLGLGGIQVTFAQKPNGTWEVNEPPILYGI